MSHFFAVVHKDDDSAYGVHFPDAPGCFSAADDPADILPNAIEALSLYFEDCEVVEARGVEAIRAEASEDLAAGAYLLAVPLVVNDTAPVRVNVSIERGILRAIDAEAEVRNQTRSGFLVEAARSVIVGPAAERNAAVDARAAKAGAKYNPKGGAATMVATSKNPKPSRSTGGEAKPKRRDGKPRRA